MEFIIFWILLCIIPAIMAGKRGRSSFGWLVFSILLSPILGILFLWALGDTETKKRLDQWSVTPEDVAKMYQEKVKKTLPDNLRERGM